LLTEDHDGELVVNVPVTPTAETAYRSVPCRTVSPSITKRSKPTMSRTMRLNSAELSRAFFHRSGGT